MISRAKVDMTSTAWNAQHIAEQTAVRGLQQRKYFSKLIHVKIAAAIVSMAYPHVVYLLFHNDDCVRLAHRAALG